MSYPTGRNKEFFGTKSQSSRKYDLFMSQDHQNVIVVPYRSGYV